MDELRGEVGDEPEGYHDADKLEDIDSPPDAAFLGGKPDIDDIPASGEVVRSSVNATDSGDVFLVIRDVAALDLVGLHSDARAADDERFFLAELGE